ncbi:MAG: HIT domain-containing protein [Magnetococcales bacterium]|nr:HIT domain-containing protein [Magnetococcales bacterium]
MTSFTLHPDLARAGIFLGKLSLSQLLLMNDARYPWLVLVPERPGLRDFDEVAGDDVPLLHADISLVCSTLRHLFHPDKLNVASLGNMVPQLHIHVIARFQTDAAWPHPVWGVYPPLPYSEELLEKRLISIKSAIDIQTSNFLK